MKKILITLALIMGIALSANAQFEQKKWYAGASLTGLNLSYNGLEKLRLGAQAQGGYFIKDQIMLLGQASIELSDNDAVANHFKLGAGGRYYFQNNGVFLGANVQFLHANHNHNDVMPGFEVGYAFFINGLVTIEPAIYYQQSFQSHSDYSTVGLRIGFGIYK